MCLYGKIKFYITESISHCLMKVSFRVYTQQPCWLYAFSGKDLLFKYTYHSKTIVCSFHTMLYISSAQCRFLGRLLNFRLVQPSQIQGGSTTPITQKALLDKVNRKERKVRINSSYVEANSNPFGTLVSSLVKLYWSVFFIFSDPVRPAFFNLVLSVTVIVNNCGFRATDTTRLVLQCSNLSRDLFIFLEIPPHIPASFSFTITNYTHRS